MEDTIELRSNDSELNFKQFSSDNSRNFFIILFH